MRNTNTAMTLEEAHALVQRDEALDAAVARVARVDFSMLKRKLVEEQKHAPEAVASAEDLYRKFLALKLRYPGRVLAPTGPIDTFWHAHILDTRAYAHDCQELFGGYLHHYPYFGMRGPEDRADLERAFADTIDLFIRHYGIDPTAGDAHARSCRPQRCP